MVRWNRTYGGKERDLANAIIETPDGGYILAGETWSFGTERNSDVWLIKTDATGNVEWNQTYGGEGNEGASSLIGTIDGGYAVAGSTTSFGNGSSDCWLIKIDSNWNMQWNQTYGGEEGDNVASLIQTSDGGYALAGKTYSFGVGSAIFLVKTDAAGNLEWYQTYEREDSVSANSVTETPDGGFVLSGSTQYAGLTAFWLIKTDSYGNMEWNRTYAKMGYGNVKTLLVTADGGYVAAGSKWNTEHTEVWLMKTDTNGNMEWNQTYEGTKHSGAIYEELEDNFACFLIATTDGGYALVCSSDYDVIVPDGGWADIWLIKTDTNGNMEWNHTYGGTQYETATSLIETSDGGYAISGFQRPVFSTRSYDALLIKTDAYGITQEFDNIEAVELKEPKTIVVPNDYATIQEAIANATAGDTVFVKKGTYFVGYYETIDKPLALIGEDPQSTIINGGWDKKHWDRVTLQVTVPGVTISGFTFTNCEIAISIRSDFYSLVTTRIVNNIFSDKCNRAIQVQSANNVLIAENNSTSSMGISFSSNCTIYGNKITNHAVTIGSSINVTVKENTISNSNVGLNIEWGGPYYIYNNNITDNQETGIKFSRHCIHVDVYKNNVRNNSIGVELHNSRLMNENKLGSNNTFHQNNFVENSQQVVVEPVPENEQLSTIYKDVVSWDKNGEGNYWSNYKGTDSDKNGIGNTPYVIDENNQDNYPLMHIVEIKENLDVSLLILLIFGLFIVMVLLVIYRRGLKVCKKNV